MSRSYKSKVQCVLSGESESPVSHCSSNQRRDTTNIIKPVSPANAHLDQSSSDWILEHYRDIQLPVHHARKSLKNLTHPSEIRKWSRVSGKSGGSQRGKKRSGRESGTGESLSPMRKKRGSEEVPDVFDHLATLRRKQKSQMERDSQKVPTTPQLDLADYDLSLHFSQTTSPKNTSKRSQSKSSHKGTLLCPPELSCQGSVISKGGEFRSEEPFIQPLSVSTETEEGETSLECGASSLLDQVEAERPFQFAQVVSLV